MYLHTVVGLYSPYAGNDGSCLPCPTASAPGAFTCQGCEPGKSKHETVQNDIDGDDDCDVCVAGKFTDERDVDTCKDCPKGYYTNDLQSLDGLIRLDRCQECPRGKYGNQTQQTTKEAGCRNCTRGRYSEIDGLAKETVFTVCKPCAAGKYSTEEGNAKDSQCKNCGSGTWSSTVAASSVDDCNKCGIGKFSANVGVADETFCGLCKIHMLYVYLCCWMLFRMVLVLVDVHVHMNYYWFSHSLFYLYSRTVLILLLLPPPPQVTLGTNNQKKARHIVCHARQESLEKKTGKGFVSVTCAC